MLATPKNYGLVHTGSNEKGRIVFSISFKRKHLGYYCEGKWEDMQDNDCDFDSLELCLEGIYDMYEYEKKYEFKYWIDEVKIKVEVN